MKAVSKLIYKTYMTYLPTGFPVHYYGMPDGNVYLIYARFYKVTFGHSGLEFVIARHDEFSFDYETEELFSAAEDSDNMKMYNEMVDKPEPKIKIIKVYRSLESYSEAVDKLNKLAHSRMTECESI